MSVWRMRYTTRWLLMLAVSDMADPIVDDADGRRADFERQIDALRAARPSVDAQRAEAAHLLKESRDAERRNHFAEAIIKSMRRRQ